VNDNELLIKNTFTLEVLPSTIKQKSTTVFINILKNKDDSRRVWRYQREVIRIRISKKNRQPNDEEKKYKRTTNDLQNIHIKLKIE
jgi:hypothetical protein